MVRCCARFSLLAIRYRLFVLQPLLLVVSAAAATRCRCSLAAVLPQSQIAAYKKKMTVAYEDI